MATTRIKGIAALALTGLALLPAAALAKDSDKDGLPDSWEKRKTPAGLNLKALGANPKHRDVFVEFNYSKSLSPADISCGALDDLVTAFRKGPVKNPDHKDGIKLHIDAGKKCGHKGNAGYDLGESGSFKVNSSGCTNPTDLNHTIRGKRLNVFHNGGVTTDSQLCGAEGFADSTDFIVKQRGGGSGFAFVVMHELGHVFGLDHGPFNGFSVMSGGAFRYPTASTDSLLDYTRYPVQALNESSLDETKGYTTGSAAGDAYLSKVYGPQYCLEDDPFNPGGPQHQQLVLQGPAHGGLDFNCSGAPFWMPPYSQYLSPSPVPYDVNGDGAIGTVPAVKPEWPKLKFGLGRIGG